jgi:hypothetical protein
VNLPAERRASGTRNGMDVLGSFFRKPTASARDADIEAVRSGESRIVACVFRGLFGAYPHGFRFGKLSISRTSAEWRPYWWALNRRRWDIRAQVVRAYVRPRNPETDGRVRSTGAYAPDGWLSASGFSVIVCETPDGTLEFAVPNPDIPLLLFVFSKLWKA